MKRSSFVRSLAGLSVLAGTFALAVPAMATTMIKYTGDTSGLTDLLDGFNDTQSNTYAGVNLSTTTPNVLKKKGNGIADLTLSLEDSTLGFGQLIIGLNTTKGSPVTIAGTVTLIDGSSVSLTPFDFSYSSGYNGVTLFSIQDAGNLFTSLTLNFNTDTSQIKYLYTAEVGTLPTSIVPGVPEPAVWGMMILGFGLVGVATRRRSKRLTVRLA